MTSISKSGVNELNVLGYTVGILARKCRGTLSVPGHLPNPYIDQDGSAARPDSL